MEIKRGDTFAFLVVMNDQTNQPIIISPTNLKCQIRDVANKLVCLMDISETEIPGQYLFEAESTDEWPIGKVMYDIRYIIEGKKYRTQTSTIDVIKEITKDVD